MNELRDITIKPQANNQGAKSPYSELVEAIKIHGQEDPNFKYKVFETGNKNARIDTNLVVEGDKRLSILIKTDGSVEFYKANPDSQIIEAKITKRGGLEPTISTKGGTPIVQAAELPTKGVTLGANEMLGISDSPNQAAKNFKDLVINTKLVEGLEHIKSQPGSELAYKVKLAPGSGIQTTTKIAMGANNESINIFQHGGEIKIPGAADSKLKIGDVLQVIEGKTRSSVGQITDSSKSKTPVTTLAQQIPTTTSTTSPAETIAPATVKKPVIIGKSGTGIVGTAVAVLLTAKVANSGDELGKMVFGEMLNNLINPTASAPATKTPIAIPRTPEELGALLSNGTKKIISQAQKELTQHGIKPPSNKDVEPQHISSKPEVAAQAGRGGKT